jgi:hypothetical protein
MPLLRPLTFPVISPPAWRIAGITPIGVFDFVVDV